MSLQKQTKLKFMRYRLGKLVEKYGLHDRRVIALDRKLNSLIVEIQREDLCQK